MKYSLHSCFILFLNKTVQWWQWWNATNLEANVKESVWHSVSKTVEIQFFKKINLKAKNEKKKKKASIMTFVMFWKTGWILYPAKLYFHCKGKGQPQSWVNARQTTQWTCLDKNSMLGKIYPSTSLCSYSLFNSLVTSPDPILLYRHFQILQPPRSKDALLLRTNVVEPLSMQEFLFLGAFHGYQQLWWASLHSQ